jgi:hypothetical protein
MPELRGLQILAVRDPDGDVTITAYLDGEHDVKTETVDPGRGYTVEEWQNSITDAEALPPSQFRDDLTGALLDPPGTEFITGWQDESRWVEFDATRPKEA